MKFIVTMKDPDGVYESLRQAARMKMINEHANKNPKWNVPDSGTVAFADLENEIDEALAAVIQAVQLRCHGTLRS